MERWGLVTWIGVLLVILVLVIYYKGASQLATNGASAFGTTVMYLTGKTRFGGAAYATGG